VPDLVAKNRSRFEVVWQGTSAIPAMRIFGNETHVAGDVARSTVSEDQLQPALETLKNQSARLISVNPVGGSLEEYFLQKLGEPAEVPR